MNTLLMAISPLYLIERTSGVLPAALVAVAGWLVMRRASNA